MVPLKGDSHGAELVLYFFGEDKNAGSPLSY